MTTIVQWQQVLATVVLGAILSHVTRAGYDNTVCDMDAFKREASVNQGPSKPVLASRYSLRVEANLLEDNRTVDAHEFYDTDNNRGGLDQWDRGIETRILYDFKTNELITVTFPDRADPGRQYTQCEVQRLNNTHSYVFGAHMYSNGTSHIYSIGDTLRMAANQPDIYLGQVNRNDDVIAEAWKSCIYMANLDATFNATWYFTARDVWSSTMGPEVQAPLELHITGRVGGAHAHGFDHVYSFSEYRPNFRDFSYASEVFETPQSVYCYNRVSTMPLPNMTDNFSFSSEIVDTGTKSITYLSEYYDYAIRAMRYEFQSLKGSVYGSNPLIRVHDFNTGVAYTTDTVRGNCTATPISTLGFDAESQDSAFVRMRTAEQFFGFDTSSYTYTGQRTVRDIECDVWIRINDDWPPKTPFETHWEWYFATRQWMESVGYQYEVRLPVQLRITAEAFTPPFERVFNFYDYKEKQNHPWDFSISACFDSQHRKEYTLTIPGNYTKYVAPNKNNFLFYFYTAVTAHAQVSFTRVANAQFDFDDVNIYASFSLLDKAPITGDVKNTEPERDLTQAAALMEADVTSGIFFIMLPLQTGGMLQKLQVTNFSVGRLPTPKAAPPPLPQHRQRHRREGDTVTASLAKVEEQGIEVEGGGTANGGQLQLDVKAPVSTDTSTTYTAGAMAGLAIAMVVVGFSISFLVTLLLCRRYLTPREQDLGHPLTELHSDKN